MMTSSNRNIFRVIGPLRGDFTGHRWTPLTKTSDAELWWFLWSLPEKTVSKQSRCLWFETPLRALWRHCDATCNEYHVIMNCVMKNTGCGLVPAFHCVLKRMFRWFNIMGTGRLIGTRASAKCWRVDSDRYSPGCPCAINKCKWAPCLIPLDKRLSISYTFVCALTRCLY